MQCHKNLKAFAYKYVAYKATSVEYYGGYIARLLPGS